jgi:hypothetical protein
LIISIGRMSLSRKGIHLLDLVKGRTAPIVNLAGKS